MLARRLGLIAVATGTLAGGGLWLHQRAEAKDRPAYRFVAVEKGDLEVQVSATGNLAAVRTVQVGTQVSGQVAEILVDYNDRVRKGQLLARIDPTLARQAVADAQAGLDRALAEQAAAQQEEQRNRTLVQEGLLAPSAFEPMQTRLAVAKANVSSARVAVQRARQNLAYTEIHSPIDGVVVERNVDVGQTVAASLSAPQLFLIANDLSHMQIVVSVDESDIASIREGQQARFTVQARPRERFSGRVQQVRLQSTTLENVVSYGVVVTVDNPEMKLLPGMTARVDFMVDSAADVLKVANAALRFRPEGPAAAARAAARAQQAALDARRREAEGGAGARRPQRRRDDRGRRRRPGARDGGDRRRADGGRRARGGQSAPAAHGRRREPPAGRRVLRDAMTTETVIRTEGLGKVYRTGRNEVAALRGVDLTVSAGEMVAVMGTSGSGKSTLMNILGCLDQPTSGAYFLDGARVDGLPKRALADIRNRKIGFVFQGFNLLPRTSALENVEMPLLYDRSGRKLDTRKLAEGALARVGLADRLDHQSSELSGGQQQRVAIARALVTTPALLLADEPTGNLDSRTSLEVMALFQELHAQGMTILLVTHEPDVAQYAERIVEVRDGRIRRDVPVAERRQAAADLAERDRSEEASAA